MKPVEVAKAWWAAFNAGEYGTAAALLSPDTTVDWPVSGERMQSPTEWREIKEKYPAHTPWRAEIIDVVVEGNNVVTFTQVYDGRTTDFAISRFTIQGDRIVRLVEFWPEPAAAPNWRKQWIVPLPDAENPLKRS